MKELLPEIIVFSMFVVIGLLGLFIANLDKFVKKET
jgi:uncharacterized membrane protein YwzB